MSGDTDAATESRRAKGCNKLLGKTVRLQSGDWLGRTVQAAIVDKDTRQKAKARAEEIVKFRLRKSLNLDML